MYVMMRCVCVCVLVITVFIYSTILGIARLPYAGLNNTEKHSVFVRIANFINIDE